MLAGWVHKRTHLSEPVGLLCWERPSCLPLSFSPSHTDKKMCFSFSHLHFASPQHQSASEAHLPSEPWEGKLRPGHHSSQGCLLGCLGLKYKQAHFLTVRLFFFPRGGSGRRGLGPGRELNLPPRNCPALAKLPGILARPQRRVIFSLCIQCSCFANLLSLGIVERNECLAPAQSEMCLCSEMKLNFKCQFIFA